MTAAAERRALYRPPESADLIGERYAALLAEWPLPAQQRRLPTSQGDTFVLTCGAADRPPVLLIHGAIANVSSWMGDVEALGAHFHLHAVDVVGEPGFSAPSRPPLDSDAYARWLSEVLDGLGLSTAAVVGISLGGWLGLDLAIRRPARVSALAVIVPGGVGPQRNVLAWAIPLSLLGPWGRRKVRERIMGPAPPQAGLSDTQRRFGELYALMSRHFRPRYDRLPIFSDAALAALPMPVMAVVAGRDVMLAPGPMRRRLEDNVPDLTMHYLPEARHFPGSQTDRLLDFLQRATVSATIPAPSAVE